MNKFYSVLTAAALAAGVSASAQVADFQLNEALREYAPKTVAAKINTNIAPNVEANLSRADHWCTGTMYHYSNSFYRVDQFEIPTDLANDGSDVIYTMHGLFPSQNNPAGSSIQMIIHPNGTVTIPVQQGPYISDFWSFSGNAPAGLTEGYGYMCDIATANTAMNPKLGPLVTGVTQEQLEAASFYDAENGVVHLMSFMFFQYDGLKLNDGITTIDTLYPFDFSIPYPDDYNAFRSETIQLGDWGSLQDVDYTDSYLPNLGFPVETYKVGIQQNVNFPAAYRVVRPFENNSELLASDFITDSTGQPIDAVMLINSWNGNYFLGNTYSGLHIEGVAAPEFEFQSYINYMYTNGFSKEDLLARTQIANGDQVLYNGKPFGTINNDYLTVPEYANFYVAIVEYSDPTSGFTAYLPQEAPYFVPNDFFKLQWPFGGVEAVTVDNENAPVEFYNLQGIRVNTTTAGNVYIRRQGSDVTKVIL